MPIYDFLDLIHEVHQFTPVPSPDLGQTYPLEAVTFSKDQIQAFLDEWGIKPKDESSANL